MPYVSYPNVQLIGQGGNMTCWYASAQMIVRWHRQRMQMSTIAGWSVDTAGATSSTNTANTPLNPTTVAQFARDNQLQTVYMSVTPDGLGSLLSLYGPLWYGGNVRGYRGVNTGAHVVVITGIIDETVYINDPWPPNQGTRLQLDHHTFFNQLQARAEVPMLHI